MPLRGVLRIVRQLLEAARDQHARPPVLAGDFVSFHTHEWIRPHPFNFLAECRECEQTVAFVREVDGNDVGLIPVGASQPAESRAL